MPVIKHDTTSMNHYTSVNLCNLSIVPKFIFKQNEEERGNEDWSVKNNKKKK